MNTSKFQILEQNRTYKPIPKGSIQLVDRLEPGLYDLKENLSGLFLTPGPEQVVPKIYGTRVLEVRDIIWSSWQMQGFNSQGAMLSGLKGSGKTLVAKLIALLAIESGFPVILITDTVGGNALTDFCLQLETPVVLLFEEYEKNYKPGGGAEESLLNFLDGLNNLRVLSVFTANRTDKMSNYLVNRPSRIKYHFQFSELDPTFIQEYVEQNLQTDDASKTASLVGRLKSFSEINFDMLQMAVLECNLRPQLSVWEALQYLNFRNTTVSYSAYLCDQAGNIIPHLSPYDLLLNLGREFGNSDIYFRYSAEYFHKHYPKLNLQEYEALCQRIPEAARFYGPMDVSESFYAPQSRFPLFEFEGEDLLISSKDFVRISNEGVWHFKPKTETDKDTPFLVALIKGTDLRPQ